MPPFLTQTAGFTGLGVVPPCSTNRDAEPCEASSSSACGGRRPNSDEISVSMVPDNRTTAVMTDWFDEERPKALNFITSEVVDLSGLVRHLLELVVEEGGAGFVDPGSDAQEALWRSDLFSKSVYETPSRRYTLVSDQPLALSGGRQVRQQ